jgi:ABC-type branched-subunit amino acid transport system substrate-binding protein
MTRQLCVRVAAGLCAVLVAAACGQKPGVADQQPFTGAFAGAPGEAVLDEEGNLVDPETGEIIAPADEVGDTTTDTTTSDSSDDADTDTSGPAAPDDTASDDGPGNSTGVTDDVIKIGTHAPITGAAPVPSDSANKGAQIYWRWLEENNVTIHGRRVEAVLRNDNYNPSQAVAVCRQMVEEDEVFLLSGAAGTDQIQACARYANGVGVPYLSAGVTEVGLDTLPTYFAVSMTYPDQQVLIADFLKTELGAEDETNAIVWFNTTSFKDGHDAFIQAMDEAGLTVDYDRPVSKTAGTSEAQAVATELNQRGIDNVNLLLAPVFFLQMLSAAGAQGYRPQWTGAGIQFTFDTVATAGCQSGSLNGAKMFSPFPAWIDSNKYDPDFRKAMDAIYPDENGGDDFMWLGWMSAKALHQMLEKTGPDLTRERFMATIAANKWFNGIGPHLRFTPNDHFGADEVHVSEARCSDRRWHTIMDWVSDF